MLLFLQIPNVFQQYFQTDQAQDQATGAGSVTPEMFSQFETDSTA